MKFSVPEISCGHCTASIEKSIKAKDSAAAVSTDLETRTVSVDSKLPAVDVLQAISDAGYDAKLA
ncbi:MAG: heavy metal-associated domain-containing protein [Pacificibacter sp.]|jgi:copper chaperone|uniref:heavy-metal-associated domain-containing protein n=1 Tax=Roseobacteraceae TaxID=2854170 RepID=UPI000EC2BFAD|nr:heavy-metal-associated domain-containing protein [Amylibacter sp.]HCI07202.1 copper chaperone [Sulfitobacter sp.]